MMPQGSTIRRAARRRLSQRPWFAAVLFLAGAWVATTSLRRTFGAGEGLDGAFVAAPDALLEDDAADPFGSAAEAGPGRDLVAEFGVWRAADELPPLFADPPSSAGAAPAPLGEAALGRSGWTGDPPPPLAIGVVMVGSGSRRAVIAGRVVGIGDRVGDAVVERIERSIVVVRWRDRRLTYDFETPLPREYRAYASAQESDGTKGTPEGGR